MSLPRYTPGPVTPSHGIPHGQSHKTLKIPRPHKPKRPHRPKIDPLDRPAAPGSNLTIRQLRKLVSAAADQKFGTQERDITMRQQQIPTWFAAYRQQIKDAADAQNARTGQAVSALQGLAASAGAVDPNATPEAQAAAKVRAGLAGGQTQLAQLQGDNQTQFLQNLGLLTNQNQIMELGRAAGQLSDIHQQRGDFATTYGQQLLSDEAKQRLEDLAFGLNATKAKATITHQRRQDRIASRKVKTGNKRANRQLDISQQNADANTYRAHHPQTSKSTKDAFGNTKKDVQRNNDSWSKARTTAKFYWSHGKASFKGDWKELADFLVTAKNVNPLYAKAAAQRIANGSVDAKLAKQLRKRGVKVKVSNFSRPKYVGPDMSPGDTKSDLP
jgi:hypothetical protein